MPGLPAVALLRVRFRPRPAWCRTSQATGPVALDAVDPASVSMNCVHEPFGHLRVTPRSVHPSHANPTARDLWAPPIASLPSPRRTLLRCGVTEARSRSTGCPDRAAAKRSATFPCPAQVRDSSPPPPGPGPMTVIPARGVGHHPPAADPSRARACAREGGRRSRRGPPATRPSNDHRRDGGGLPSGRVSCLACVSREERGVPPTRRTPIMTRGGYGAMTPTRGVGAQVAIQTWCEA